MTVTDEASAAAGLGALHLEVQQFYARQMQLLDDGRVEEWALTFTDDGVFAANAHPEPAAGRAAITAAAARATEEFAAKGVKRRHWLGMLAVDPTGPTTAVARCYALVIETPRGGQSAIRVSTLCEDRLVREGDRWLVEYRYVTRDDLI
ncbi:nuclear transport factor 2 family protein [Streptomyces virginiae]|uniref:nuclear transport factor 2 family protein n=1 Tax=Streptomyces virginiae TaxID=1961 RepID=UPI0022524549|nr:nuclear transport factor 2 family protein [Streptomyces virginiae]MCX4957506.1 nuclear transport factor 2 family protein [Streptomyces virginiae]MCX5176248.1 nuclear transport factor 2 family protein [Streptomyces virginiae]